MEKKELSPGQQNALLKTLETRFENHMERHQDIAWMDIQTKLKAQPKMLWSINQMEQTGGEPDVVGYDQESKEYLFYDCSPESPSGRRSLCYDREALESRKKHKPENSAMDLAAEMGITLLSEAQYRALQNIGEFDLKTSSWVLTPPKVRALGGALFCDRRFDTVFTYHNGADSYYAARGFRGALRV